MSVLESHGFVVSNVESVLAQKKEHHQIPYACHLASNITPVLIRKPLKAHNKLMFTGMKRTSTAAKPLSCNPNEWLQKFLKGSCMFFQQWKREILISMVDVVQDVQTVGMFSALDWLACTLVLAASRKRTEVKVNEILRSKCSFLGSCCT